jgi:hypothetical protein
MRERTSDSISGEEDKIKFHLRIERKHQIPFQERKINSDSI